MVDIKDIKVLKGLEGVRKRPTRYAGSISEANGALFRSLVEPIDNVVDEYFSGNAKKLKVIIEKVKDSQIFYICDDGGGIPIEKHPDTGISGVETVVSTLHAGGKFDNTDKTIGTHGEGVAITNALSESFEVWTFRKKWYYCKYKKGIRVQSLIKKNPPFKQNKGTIIKFIPDFSILDKNKITLDMIKEKLETLTLCGITSSLVYDKKTYLFKPKSLKSYFAEMFNAAEKFGKIIEYESDNLSVYMGWSSDFESTINSFVNFSKTVNGGTHVNYVVKTLTSIISKFKKKNTFDASDLLSGLYMVISVRVNNPLFSSQTKEQLDSKVEFPEFKKFLIKFFDKHSAFANKLIKRACEVKQAKLLLKKKLKINKQTSGTNKLIGILPGILFEADPNTPKEKRELYIVEGKSAGGTAKEAKSPHQEVLKIRGKFFNAFKTQPLQFFENEIVQNIRKAINISFGKDCNLKTMRVGKIFLLMDADSDGRHIESLVLSFFVKYFKPLIDENKVFIVKTPLRVVNIKDKKYFGNTLDDLSKVSGVKDVSKYNPVRMKGWAEADAKTLQMIAFTPNKEIISLNKLTKTQEQNVNNIMGLESTTRKEILGL